jgi:hypothetical protein
VRAKPNQPATVSVEIENKKGLPPTRASQTKPAHHCFQWRKTLLPLPAMPPLNPDEGIFAQSQPVRHTCIYTKLTLESLFSFHCSPPAATPAFHIQTVDSLPASCCRSDQKDDASGEEDDKSINGGPRYISVIRPHGYFSAIRHRERQGPAPLCKHDFFQFQ